jgi:tol-pal system protein YbgF
VSQSIASLGGALLLASSSLVWAASPSELILLQKLEALERQVQSLNSQLDQQARALRDFKQEQSGHNAATDARLDELSADKPAQIAPVNPATPSKPALTQGSEREDYQSAFNQLMKGEAATAQAGFQAFITAYPKSPLLSNAYYWLGEAYLAQKNPQEAVKSFDQAIAQDPSNPKARDALLKKGYALLDLGQKSEAKTIFEKVVADYPDSSAARLARQKLGSL